MPSTERITATRRLASRSCAVGTRDLLFAAHNLRRLNVNIQRLAGMAVCLTADDAFSVPLPAPPAASQPPRGLTGTDSDADADSKVDDGPQPAPERLVDSPVIDVAGADSRRHALKEMSMDPVFVRQPSSSFATLVSRTCREVFEPFVLLRDSSAGPPLFDITTRY